MPEMLMRGRGEPREKEKKLRAPSSCQMCRRWPTSGSTHGSRCGTQEEARPQATGSMAQGTMGHHVEGPPPLLEDAGGDGVEEGKRR